MDRQTNQLRVFTGDTKDQAQIILFGHIIQSSHSLRKALILGNMEG